jgi:uncharacterized membrane protein HdeD (DUF308 family)
MLILSWSLIAVGVLLAVSAFVLTAHTPTVNFWPFLAAGFTSTVLGIFLLMTEGRDRREK